MAAVPPSSSATTTSHPFPNTSSPAIKSNPHPYAIKTTSTGILTRSNSTTSSNSSHRFVPPSPSKRSTTRSSFDGGGGDGSPVRRHNAHKYSRSLNSSELPRPLPIPPTFAASPTAAEFGVLPQPQDVDSFGRRERRADTLPSVSQPDLATSTSGGAHLDLPDDPRIWSPSQLSTYLASSLRITSGDVSPLVVQDLAGFVRTHKINGRKFLRLTEGDLDRYALNQRWQSLLLGASRALRQDSLRGRIWTSPYHPSAELNDNDNNGNDNYDNDDDDDDNANYSSTSSVSSSGSVSGLHRGRQHPLSQSLSGRVKGMVASFERSTSPTKEPSLSASVGPGTGVSTGRRSISPTKPAANPDSGATPSFGSRIRPRPQSDTFPSRPPFTFPPAYSAVPAPTPRDNNDVGDSGGVMGVVTSPEPEPELIVGGNGGGTGGAWEPRNPDHQQHHQQQPRLLPLPPTHTHASPRPQFDGLNSNSNIHPNFVSSFGPYALSPSHPSAPSPPFELPSGALSFSPQFTDSTYINIGSPPPPQLNQSAPSSTPPVFQSGVLPFSPQSTGATYFSMVSPPPPEEPVYAPQPIMPQQSMFDAFGDDSNNEDKSREYHRQHGMPAAEGVARPLPLPPHPGQHPHPQQQPYYSYDQQGPMMMYSNSPIPGDGRASSSSIVGADRSASGSDDNFIRGDTAALSLSSLDHPPPRGDHRQPLQHHHPHNSIPTPLPHVQTDNSAFLGVPGDYTNVSPSPFSPPHHSPLVQHPYQQQPLQPQSLQSLQPQQQQQQQQHLPIPIHAPQPRSQLQGRESPTKVLEEKLEELLEPRPRSRLVPTAPHHRHHSGSRSRPRSRVASMVFTPDQANGSLNNNEANNDNSASVVGGARGGEEKHQVGNGDTLGVDGDLPLLDATPRAPSHLHPRTRVISLSRVHSHRLSGVEAWGESHRHVSLSAPPVDIDGEDGNDDDELHIISTEEVKELEGEEEEQVGAGIEAVLEKEVPAVVVVPQPPISLDSFITGVGHAKEPSGTSTSTTSAPSSRAGSLREPKSAVITLVDNVVNVSHRKSSSSLSKRSGGRKPSPFTHAHAPPLSTSVRRGEGGEGEEEQSIEALLAKAGLGVEEGGSARVSDKTRKRAPMNGAEAWEMMGHVETVKHVDGVEAVPTAGAGAGSRKTSGGLARSIEDIFSPAPVPVTLGSTAKQADFSPPTPQSQKDRQGRTDREREKELEKSIDETRKMVDEIRCRLVTVEQWISDTEHRQQRQQQKGTWPAATADVVRKVLSASRIPGMLGLSAWLGSSSSPSSTPSLFSTSTPTPSTPASTQTKTRNPRTSPSSSSTPARPTLILRFAKLGLSLSTYAVLFGIGICVVILRILGRRPGAANLFARLGIRGGHGVRATANGNGIPRR